MAKQIQIELQAKTDHAVNEIGALKGEIQKLNKEAAKGSKETSDGLKDVGESSKEASGGIKGIGTALKAAGIGLAIAAFTKLSEVFQQNQKVSDFFNTSFEVLSIALNDFVNFIVGSTSGVVDFFKSLFENPKQSLLDFANAFKRNIQERFESFLDTLGLLASAVKKVFSGDFKGALEDVKSAGKESLDVLTGVNNTFDKGAVAVTKIAEATSNYAKETIKAAAANVELEKNARLAEVANQGLIEKFDRQAEQLRQIRDDESKTFEERIAANNKLAKVLDEQEKAMMANADARIAQAAAELSKNKDNIDLQIAYQEALNESAAIEAQVTGFRSEQQTNVNSLLKEQVDAKREIAAIGLTELEEERLEALNLYNDRKLLIEKTITDEEERVAALKLIKDNYDNYLIASDAAVAAEQKKIDDDDLKAQKKIQKAKEDMAKQSLSNISNALGSTTKAGKAAAAAAALINTYQGITAELATKTATPFGFVLKLANIAATASIGFKAVKDILKTNPEEESDTGDTSNSTITGGRPAAEPVPPAFNVVGASDTNQLAEAIGGVAQQPVKAFVVSNDVSTAQELDRNIVEGASIG